MKKIFLILFIILFSKLSAQTNVDTLEYNGFIMKTKAFITYKTILFLVLLLNIQGSKIAAQGSDVINQLYEFKNDSIEYIVIENIKKSTLENHLMSRFTAEYKVTEEGFKIYNASIGDLYSFIYQVKRYQIKIDSPQLILYNIVYKGDSNDSIKKEIFQKIAALKKLKISENKLSQNFYILDTKHSKKLKKYISKSNSITSFMNGNNEKCVFSNSPFSDIVEHLNKMFPDQFKFEEQEKIRYSLEIPNGKSEKYIIKYLKRKFGIKIKKTRQIVTIYTLQYSIF